jgi:hypothetical protein
VLAYNGDETGYLNGQASWLGLAAPTRAARRLLLIALALGHQGGLSGLEAAVPRTCIADAAIGIGEFRS